MMAFTERGWAPEDVKPRENVFTYKAWQALGRQVRKGEKGVKVCVYITTEETVEQYGIPYRPDRSEEVAAYQGGWRHAGPLDT